MESEHEGRMANVRHGCPEAEDLAAYLDGTSPPPARQDLERHLADCDDCRSVVVESAAFRAAHSSGDDTGRRDRTAQRALAIGSVLAAAAALVIAVRIVSPRFGTGRSVAGDDPSWTALVIAIEREPRRPAEGRVIGLSYAPQPLLKRGGSMSSPSPDVRIAAAAVENDAMHTNAPAKRIQLGVALLAVGDLDRAVETLDRAVHDTPDAEAYNDLSVAYLTRALRNNRASDLPLALGAARRARTLRPDSAAAWFNEALTLDALNRPSDARLAMDAYLKLDANSRWADELRERLRH
jgi:tetratricopeptide (TPR) repeat protein